MKSIGGKKTAKRKTNIRRFFQSSQKICFSDPFIDDEAEIEKFALNFEPIRFSIHLNYKENNVENDDDTDPDGILIKPNLEEAEKFISQLNFSNQVNNTKENKPVCKRIESISKADIDAFKTQSDLLANLKKGEIIENSDPDEFLI